jgi:hypothetical protein
MITVQFKKTSGSAAQSFSALYAPLAYETDEIKYTDMNMDRHRSIRSTYKKWDVYFGLLSDADMIYLDELAIEPAPQMILDATTYDVEILDTNIKHKGGNIEIIKREPE